MVTNSNHLKQGSWWDLTSEIKVGAKSKLFVIVDNFYCRSASSQFTVLSQPCVLHSVPGASASSDMERCQRLPILCRKKPKRTVKLSFDKLPWLFNRLVFLLLMLLVVFMVTLLYLFGTLLPVSLLFCTMCLWRRRPFEFRNERKRAGGLHESSVSSPESEWQRKEWERCSAFAKENSFPGWDASGVQKPCDYHLKRLSLTPSLSFTVSLSQTQCTIIWLSAEVFFL